MDPQAFVKLSIGSLGLRIPPVTSKSAHNGITASSSTCFCEIRLKGFPVNTASVPFISSPDATPDMHVTGTNFYLEESNVKALLTPGCFHPSHACLEINVFLGRKGFNCGVSSKKQHIGTFRLQVGPEWGEAKPTLLHSGWVGIGKNKQDDRKPGAELHLIVKLDPDPRYVFQFEDGTALSPQIVQLHGTTRQPIFSCKFSRDRRVSQMDPMSNYWSSSTSGSEKEIDRGERKGWKVMIHDLSGSAIAAAFMTTPFVPSTGYDRVERSNPGAWLIVHPDTYRPESWQPWGKLEAWREHSSRDSVCFRFHLLAEGQEGCGFVVSDILISADKGGEFFIDTDRQTLSALPTPCPQGSEEITLVAPNVEGFVMNCKVQGEGKVSKPLVQLATRHVSCLEDAAIFMALAAAVDLSIEACRPFHRKAKRGTRGSF